MKSQNGGGSAGVVVRRQSPMIRFFFDINYPKLLNFLIIPVAAIFPSFQDLCKCREIDIAKKSGGQVWRIRSVGFPGSVFRRTVCCDVNAIWEEVQTMLRCAYCITIFQFDCARQVMEPGAGVGVSMDSGT